MDRQRVRRGSRLAVAVLAAGALAACGSDGYEAAGPFRPLPEGPPPEVGPPTQGLPPAPAPGEPAEPEAEEDAGDPNVVAADLVLPTGLALLPDGSALVGERDSGRLFQVFPDRSPAQELMTVPGIDPSGDGGLLGLALSPTFEQDGLVYAYLSTATDNRVVRFPIGGTPNPVLTGIPRGEVHNGGGLVFAPDGTLYVGTGDAGNPALAADPASLAGKVLHVDVFGQPVGSGPVFTRGHSDVTALCLGEGALFGTDVHAAGPDELNLLTAGGDYGWPGPGAGIGPVLQVPDAEGGLDGCAVAGATVFLGALDGRRVHVVQLDPAGRPAEDPGEFLTDRYGRLRSLALDAAGALWITTSNRDGAGQPAEDDDRVLRILPPGGEAGSPL